MCDLFFSPQQTTVIVVVIIGTFCPQMGPPPLSRVHLVSFEELYEFLFFFYFFRSLLFFSRTPRVVDREEAVLLIHNVNIISIVRGRKELRSSPPKHNRSAEPPCNGGGGGSPPPHQSQVPLSPVPLSDGGGGTVGRGRAFA